MLDEGEEEDVVIQAVPEVEVATVDLRVENAGEGRDQGGGEKVENEEKPVNQS